MTKTEFAQECDINVIMKRYEATGQITHLNQRQPMWIDAPDMDFQGALHLVESARADFMALPSDIRTRFNNDPGQLLAFVADRNNLEEARKLGLLKPVASASIPPTTPTPSTPPSAS